MKNLCFFTSKFSVNMTDEEWLQFFDKKFQVLKCFTSPRTYVWSRDREDAYVLLWNANYWSLCDHFSCVALKILLWSARNNATSDNWVLPIIWCMPVLFSLFILNGDRQEIQRWKYMKSVDFINAKIIMFKIIPFCLFEYPWRIHN